MATCGASIGSVGKFKKL
uniref:Uncharacterized protein n=1 Tax=Oryza sativa subsp. japonica TaxID=39947 RepID=Q2QQ76_ORYSJ|nr:hypothetical protein LOC_Os12g31969 [Oryza sativa Japonica Group]